jgi:hypothetical protein
MDIEEVEERDGAKATLDVSGEHEYIHPDYDLVLGEGKIGPTGLLSIARLRLKNPRTGSLPEFVLRWDDKDDCLDVDSLSELEEEQRLFKKGTGEYYGHHSVRISISPRVFEISLMWRGQLIYRGRLKFNLSINLSATDKAVLGDTAATSPTRTTS